MIIITGTYPPEKCGVGDYTYNLLQTKEAEGWKLLYFKDWSLKTFFHKIKIINQCPDSMINLQYPCMGYNKSISAELLCLYYAFSRKKRVAVTIHEFSQFGWKRRYISFIIFLFASKFIFTTDYEYDAASRLFYRVRNRSKVIKIYSNIKQSEQKFNILDKSYDVGYFGYLRPLKGLEDFLRIMANLKLDNNSLNIYIMGQVQPDNKDFANKIKQYAEKNGIKCLLNQEENAVADILSQTKFVFLPFPDGISERRGSFLAAARNECIILTTEGKQTTLALKQCCGFVNMENAEEDMLRFLNEDIETKKNRLDKVKKYIEEEVPKSWNEIASMYNDFLQLR